MAAQAGKKKRGKFFSYTKALVFDRSTKFFCVLKRLKPFDFSFFYLSKKKGTKCHLRLLFLPKKRMPQSCAAYNCTSRRDPSKDISFHRYNNNFMKLYIAFPLLLNIQG